MIRRVWMILLALALAMAALPLGAAATTQEAEAALYAATRRSYTASLGSYNKGSFHGYCGTMVAYQMRHLKITRSVEKADGNRMFDKYKNKERSSGGYYITPYSAKKYSLEQALNAISENGTRDVYNILVGFQWTNTEAGRKYGHTLFINGILDGTVYFVESFDSAIGGAEGSVIRLSIHEFAKYYDRWTRFEGCIHFTKEYAESLPHWEVDMTVVNQAAQFLMSQPAPQGVEGSQILRSVNAGERLCVTKILSDRDGQWYYQVLDGDYSGYVMAANTQVEQLSADDFYLEQFTMSDWIEPGQSLQLQGQVAGRRMTVNQVDAVIADSNENVLATVSLEADAVADLSKLTLPELPVGSYLLKVIARGESPYVGPEGLTYGEVAQVLVEKDYRVGPALRMFGLDSRRMEPAIEKGWLQRSGNWYYYENGAPVTGWFRENGVNYYFQENGAAATGWVTVNGQTCLFSATGALCTGWIRVEAGMHYCSEGGRFANGWINIEGSRYYFEDGIMQTSGVVSDGVEVYALQPDGQALLLAE